MVFIQEGHVLTATHTAKTNEMHILNKYQKQASYNILSINQKTMCSAIAQAFRNNYIGCPNDVGRSRD